MTFVVAGTQLSGATALAELSGEPWGDCVQSKAIPSIAPETIPADLPIRHLHLHCRYEPSYLSAALSRTGKSMGWHAGQKALTEFEPANCRP
jgi:hypothetical protein